MDDLNEITWETAEITPSIATEMLNHVHASGHVDQSALASFEKDMSAGRWVLNGAPIVLSSQGSLLDGRARLHACVKSGASFQTLVVRGVSSSAFETIDSIRKRTLADVLSIRSRCGHAGSLDGMVELIDAGRYPFDKEATGLGQPGASCATLEQEDAKIFFQRLDPRADTRLTNAKRPRGSMKAKIFGDGERLDQRGHRYAPA